MLRWRLVQDIEREHSVKHTSPYPGTYGHVGLYLTYLFNLDSTLCEYYRTSGYVMLTLCTQYQITRYYMHSRTYDRE